MKGDQKRLGVDDPVVQITRQQRKMMGSFPRFPGLGRAYLDLLQEEKEIGTSLVACRYYQYDPMLDIEFPNGFCTRPGAPFTECDCIKGNPEACPNYMPRASESKESKEDGKEKSCGLLGKLLRVALRAIGK